MYLALAIVVFISLQASAQHILRGKVIDAATGKPLGIHQNLGRHFEADAYVGGTNLTNTRYYLMVFVNQLPDAYIPAPRNANLFGGVNLKYNL